MFCRRQKNVCYARPDVGCTGSIGTAVVAVLVLRGHHVTALARSDASMRKLQALGAEVLAGDIRMPERWLSMADRIGGVTHSRERLRIGHGGARPKVARGAAAPALG